MSLPVMMVVLLAALLHATWNFLVKNTEDKYLSMSAVVLGHTPFALIALFVSPLPRFEAWPYLVVGAMLHVGYQLFLLASYRIGDLSQVYPLARGVAPMIVAGVSVLFLGVDLSRLEMAAVLIIGSGIMSLALVRRRDGLRNGQAAFLSIVTGCFIASYSLVDGLGAREAGTSLGFYGCLSVLNAIGFAAVMRVLRPGTLRRVVCREWRFALKGGGASFSAYAMVTWAFTLAPIAMVAAVRETSIIFALVLGVVVLKERLDLMKVVSTLLTLLGVGILRVGR
ncbi:DMT family transporter [Desulfoluna sp.]|uniref:DMT family transporter n=1 Tax=Desulfoluna sp. TaxID=2045199 RepID=UPI002603B74C|nr:DMT family transporter [Desulfoluna sp.]